MKDSLPPGPRRLHTVTRKIAAEETGLNAAFYLQVDRGAAGQVVGARFKTPGKFENSDIERLLAVMNRHLAAELSPQEEADFAATITVAEEDTRGVFPTKHPGED